MCISYGGGDGRNRVVLGQSFQMLSDDENFYVEKNEYPSLIPSSVVI